MKSLLRTNWSETQKRSVQPDTRILYCIRIRISLPPGLRLMWKKSRFFFGSSIFFGCNVKTVYFIWRFDVFLNWRLLMWINNSGVSPIPETFEPACRCHSLCYFFCWKKVTKKAALCKGALAHARASAQKLLLPHPFTPARIGLIREWYLTIISSAGTCADV